MILLFLWHIPSALIPVITIPIAVLLSFIPFRMMGITANIMSLGGIAIAIGGENVTTTVEGRERYPVNVRYMRDFRGDLGALGRVLVPASGGQKQILFSQLASIRAASGPSMIRNEDGPLTGYVYVDIAGRDPNGYVEEAERLLFEVKKQLSSLAK